MEYRGYLVSIDVTPQNSIQSNVCVSGRFQTGNFPEWGCRKLLIACSRFRNKIPDYVCTYVSIYFIMTYRH